MILRRWLHILIMCSIGGVAGSALYGKGLLPALLAGHDHVRDFLPHGLKSPELFVRSISMILLFVVVNALPRLGGLPKRVNHMPQWVLSSLRYPPTLVAAVLGYLLTLIAAPAIGVRDFGLVQALAPVLVLVLMIPIVVFNYANPGVDRHRSDTPVAC